MRQMIIKTIISLVLILTVSEVSKRSTLIGGILISLPIVSLLAMLWLWVETRDKSRIAQFSMSVFWLVIPSLLLFVSFPLFLRKMDFGWALLASCGLTVLGYYLMVLGLGALHIKL